MFGHLPELVVVLILGLIFFGPEKLPEIAGSAGKMVGELRAAFDTAMQPDQEIDDDEFSTYYYDAMHRSGEMDPDVELDDVADPADDVEFANGDDAVDLSADEPGAADTDHEESDGPRGAVPV